MIKKDKEKNDGRGGVLIYSSLIWNNIWSHSHDLTKVLSKSMPVFYLEVPKNHARGHEHLVEKNIHPVPKNTMLITPKREFKKFNLPYLIYTQWFTLKSFFKIRKNINTVITYNTYDLPLLLLSKMLGKRVVFMYVDHYEDLTPNKIAKWYISKTTKYFIKHSDYVICTARILEKYSKRYNENTTYLPNATALEKFSGKKKKPQKKFIVGFVGSLGNWVDADMIADSAKEIKELSKQNNVHKNTTNIEFWIIGPGPGAEHIKERMEKENINNIRLFGFLKHDESIEKMFSFNVAIIPFKINDITNSVSPVKLFEYWLAENPVIATRTYELSQFKDELLFVNTASEMSKEILKIYKNPAYGKKLAIMGKNLVLKKYNWNNYEKKYLELI